VLLSERAAFARAAGRTLLDDLDEIHRRYGYFRELTRGITLDVGEDKGRWIEMMNALMVSLRSDPPHRLAEERITAVVDRAAGTVREPSSGRTLSEIEGTRGNVLVFRLEGDGTDRVSIRPSGTEPKIKVYVQVHAEPDEDLDTARRRVDARADGLMRSIESLSRERMAGG
jgi:phosphoglucomutase